MPSIRKFRVEGTTFEHEAPYFGELLATQGGALPRDPAAHALWHYYIIAAKSLESKAANLVYDDELSKDFNAKQVFESVATMHGVAPESMAAYWSVIEATRRVLRLTTNADIPERFKFKPRGN